MPPLLISSQQTVRPSDHHSHTANSTSKSIILSKCRHGSPYSRSNCAPLWACRRRPLAFPCERIRLALRRGMAFYFRKTRMPLRPEPRFFNGHLSRRFLVRPYLRSRTLYSEGRCAACTIICARSCARGRGVFGSRGWYEYDPALETPGYEVANMRVQNSDHLCEAGSREKCKTSDHTRFRYSCGFLYAFLG
jgi:hypothetical protein